MCMSRPDKTFYSAEWENSLHITQLHRSALGQVHPLPDHARAPSHHPADPKFIHYLLVTVLCRYKHIISRELVCWKNPY